MELMVNTPPSHSKVNRAPNVDVACLVCLFVSELTLLIVVWVAVLTARHLVVMCETCEPPMSCDGGGKGHEFKERGSVKIRRALRSCQDRSLSHRKYRSAMRGRQDV